MNARTPRTRSRQRGAISVEASLLLPILMMLLLAFVDFGRLLWTQTVVNSAASEAARMAVLAEPSDSAVTAAAVQRVAAGGISGTPSVSVGARSPNQPVSVSVSIGFDYLMLADLVPELASHRTISSTAVMVHQP